MNTELFIYYRVREADAAAALVALREMHARLIVEFPSLRARVLRRPEADKGLQTWMEIYAIDGGVTDALQARIAAQALAWRPLVQGERHVESFAPLHACAS